MEEQDLLVSLRTSYPKLSKGQKQIASFIMENYDRAAFITASKLGQTVGVSESTVVRFAYTMGFDGYPALQRALQELIRTKLTAMQRIQLTSEMDYTDILKTVLKADIQNIRATIDAVDNHAFLQSVEAILHSKRVYVVGMRSAYPIAKFLTYYLNYICTGSVLMNGALNDACELVASIEQSDTLIAVSFPRYSSRTASAIQYAKERGATTIAITDCAASPLSAFADHLLLARSDMASFADSLVAPLSLVNAIIVAAGFHRKEHLMEHFDTLEKLWGSQQVYVTEPNSRGLV